MTIGGEFTHPSLYLVKRPHSPLFSLKGISIIYLFKKLSIVAAVTVLYVQQSHNIRSVWQIVLSKLILIIIEI